MKLRYYAKHNVYTGNKNMKKNSVFVGTENTTNLWCRLLLIAAMKVIISKKIMKMFCFLDFNTTFEHGIHHEERLKILISG